MSKNTIDQKMNDIVKFAHMAGFTSITKEMTQERYNNMNSQYGEEPANKALDYTIKDFKEKSKHAEKIFWNGVKHEIFDKLSWSPTSIRDIKAGIKSGEINITGLPSQDKIIELLGMEIEKVIVDHYITHEIAYGTSQPFPFPIKCF